MRVAPFGSVKTITLPVPDSDLTASEYKEAYGIDLETVELYDLIFLKKDNISIPVLAIDRENKILYAAESAYSYASGFKVVEGVSLISEVIESGTIENAKPVYCHPINFAEHTAADKFYLTMLVFNNDPTPFTRESLITYLSGVKGAYFALSGLFYNSSYQMPPSAIYVDNNGALWLIGYDNQGTRHSSTANQINANDLLTNCDMLEDGVNKIN